MNNLVIDPTDLQIGDILLTPLTSTLVLTDIVQSVDTNLSTRWVWVNGDDLADDSLRLRKGVSVTVLRDLSDS